MFTVNPALMMLWCFVRLVHVLAHLLISAKGYSVPKAFIAAQSPMSHTKGDFWELVWQFRTPTIVLLANFMEGTQVRVLQLLLQLGQFIYCHVNAAITLH